MKLLSKSFPDTLFYGAYVGEDLGDNEYVIFQQGCSMPSRDNCAFKLPLTEEVVKLTKKVQDLRNKAVDEEVENLDDLEDELTVQRENLIDIFFSKLNLTEISNLFDFED